MESAKRQTLLKDYAAGTDLLVRAIDGVSDSELDARPGAEDWSPREVIHHVADAEFQNAVRLRRLLTEDGPDIAGFDGDEYLRRLAYATRPPTADLELIRAARRANQELLETLDEAGWARSGSKGGEPYSVDDWLEINTAHPADHAEQIRVARSGGAGA